MILLTLAAAAALPAARESFEVASIRPGDPAERRIMLRMQPGGRYSAVNAPVIMLIRQAYDVADFQIAGAPEWVKSAPWNIDAKLAGDEENDPRKMTFAQAQAFQNRTRQCLQSLLEERFGLKLHRESKQMPIYSLVVAKGGPKLTEAPEPGPGKPNGLRLGRGEWISTATNMDLLVRTLSREVGRPVHDETGLKGVYDYKLNWTPGPEQMVALPGGPPGPDAPPLDPNGPSLFTALQEQLGLELESAKGPVEVLVVDRIEKPGAN